jgi:hypothetical protein
LSEKAVERRIRQQISIDETDLPLSPRYIADLEALGCKVATKSKWLKTITVHCTDSALVHRIKQLDFVEDAVLVWKRDSKETRKTNSRRSLGIQTELPSYYGNAYPQIAIHNGDSLHRAGFRGEGMDIAIIDGGFHDLSTNTLLENVLIRGRKSFVYSADSCYEVAHGLNVLSCMATDLPGLFVGTAPDAGYWLLQSENPASEYPVEEDYWVAAAEYADSIGADVINSSLGYSVFNDTTLNHTYAQTDGKTAHITLGADMAAAKGILVVTSAGNEGSDAWHYITPPADAENALTVGAITNDSIIATFSSRGPTGDGRIKPDVMAVGSRAAVISWDGNISSNSGTSFSSPIMCGLAACLWQAFPMLTNRELRDVLRQSAGNSTKPNNDYGYGIPDMIKAMKIAGGEKSSLPLPVTCNEDMKIVSDKNGHLRILKNNDDSCQVRIVSVDGKMLITDTFSGREKVYRLDLCKRGLFIVSVHSKDIAVTKKILRK